jgi:5-hydroxyisourate hydrolase-like protein (transthyretin family)
VTVPPARRMARPLVVLLVLALGAVLGPVGSVAAADPPATTLTLSAPASGRAGLAVPFTAVLRDAGSAPVAGAVVTLQRLGTAWTGVGSGTTDSAGRVVVNGTLPAGATKWRASYAGDATHAPSVSSEVTVTGVRYASTLVLSGPARLVDETTGALAFVWSAADGSPVSALVTIYRRLGTGAWTAYRRVRTNADGRGAVAIAPRVDSTWRVVGPAGSWWLADTSNDVKVDNVPATAPVAYPAGAPRPAGTPAQARATGAGANAVVTAIPQAVWRSMVRRSWHRGCPVGRKGLRLLRINYWGFDGYRYRGEMVLSSAVATRAAGALRDMYNRRFPIRRMYRVDRFGWSKKLRGANDYASMRADNTSGFNCRSVVNNPGVRSPHARGRAIDINTWENPYRSRTGLVPNSWWASRSHPRIAWRSSSHPVVQIWRSHGFRWTYGNLDSQHVDGRATALAGSFTG